MAEKAKPAGPGGLHEDEARCDSEINHIENPAACQSLFIPKPLINKNQWVVWMLSPSPDPDKKPDKIPINPNTGAGASSTQPETWGSYSDAETFYMRRKSSDLSAAGRTGKPAGIGYVFSKDDPYTGIDIDDCIDGNGKLLPWADDIVKSFDSFTEISQSGRGLHIIVRGKKPGSSCKKGAIECYDHGRYFAITGRVLNGYTEIKSRQKALDAFYHKHFQKPEPAPQVDRSTYANSNVDTSTVMARVRRSRSASKIESYLSGSNEGHNSASEADQAACNHLAFYCGEIPDSEAYHIIDRIFRESGRYREKWDRVHRPADGATYGEMTIQKALLAGNRYKMKSKPEPPAYHDDVPPPDTDDVPPEFDEQVPPEPEPGPTRRFGFIHNTVLEARMPEWVIKWFIESDSLVQIFGDPGCGKSFIGLDIAASIATGKNFHGNHTKPGAAYYMAAEGRNGIARRLKAWENRWQLSLSDSPLYISTGGGNLCDPDGAAEIVEAIESIGEPPAVIVVDTLARNFGPGDENSTKDMNMFIAALDRIRERYRCTIILIHHTGHGDKSRGRGAMALKGALDAEYRMDKDIHGTVRLEATKMKDAEIPDPMAFTITSVEIGMIDEDGETVTSAVLDSTEYQVPEKQTAGKGKHQQAATRILQNLYDEHRQRLEDGGFCPSMARVRVDDWRTACIESGINRTNFHRVKHSLTDQGVVFIEHGFVTLS